LDRGGFILIPLMGSYVRIPTKIAIGSNLAIATLSSLAAVIAKILTGQRQWAMTIPIILTVTLFAFFGGIVSSQVPVLWLRRTLAALIRVAAIWMWSSLLF